MAATLLHWDCPTGIAGDMVLAALADLGVPEAVLNRPLRQLGLADQCRIVTRAGSNGGLRGIKAHVDVLTPQEEHRHWRHLRQLLLTAPLEEQVRQAALRCFGLLAEAEARVHGCPVDAVHFHEVGALDAVADVLGACAGLCHLRVQTISCSPLPPGHGAVTTAHGLLPVPAPAVLELASAHQVPLLSCEGWPQGELVTPTGLALAVTWAGRFGGAPALAPRRVGIGLGQRQLDRPNQLRLLLGGPWPSHGHPAATLEPFQEWVVLMGCQIDDMDGEAMATLQQTVLDAGALDAWLQPVHMKKQRPGHLVQVLARPDQLKALRQVLWSHSSTLGLREQWHHRWILPRREEQRQTPLGPVRIKWATLPDGSRRGKAEHEDLAALAHHHHLPLQEVRRRIQPFLEP
ncbi:MAG: nickel pincer cofactor biosynthesis protein LarC [Synechococcus sp. SB0666_bin_14]|nr:nickel pincer cofactor biosynthesis protein LarC [Synechococcus sp. SB0666_bin_14]MYG47136.1 nickel pincer cofactor biosynthesis protein LarC [Synechococcus sp. SB0675_bin_6]MYJ59724.1 nickel pincer cofactor biosynthesis protein LarC [Synechococcus sp. SB0672_bin_6]MYK92372.1 nickel pincer cofactor biosynthesis protein LarC [Synechococcus sp. SB0669_bin_8]